MCLLFLRIQSYGESGLLPYIERNLLRQQMRQWYVLIIFILPKLYVQIHLTRGALKTPSQFVFQFVIDAFKIFSLLLSADYEREFSTNLQRSIIKKLIILKAEHIIENTEECQTCQKTFQNIIYKMAHVLSNIFLNNYSKIISDGVKDVSDSKKNRKLKTFNKQQQYLIFQLTLQVPWQLPHYMYLFVYIYFLIIKRISMLFLYLQVKTPFLLTF